MRRFDLAVTCVCCSMLGYFALHAFKGPRGYPHQQVLEQQQAMLQQKFETLREQRIRQENKVALLRPESIDPDLLDEMARRNLEMARPGDVIAFTAQ